MTRDSFRRLEMFRRVRDFGTANRADFAPDSPCLRWFAELNDVISQLTQNNAEQLAGRNTAQQSTAARSMHRIELIEHLQSINIAARVMARTRPGLDKQFAFSPRSNDAALLAAAMAFVKTAESLKDEFIKHELPADFLERLETVTIEFQETTSRRSDAWSGQRDATTAMDDTVALGMRIVDDLKALLRVKYMRNRLMTQRWNTATRVVGVSRASARATDNGASGDGDTTA
ncbi:MAG: hypothetical protein ACKV2V_22285 [Blastocatellia bacterium]